ncbi:ABC transporter ATP-binding protein [Dictyobacter kobayashii]|uniref:ABC transporter ATP-binding protein n=1 Tax=Dictyobacter kobayashii TaxID=2014872 RepID=A0A402ANQ8_9CHLR|nr:ABC transporter ATP-binding protein [Dictyobacter kobayashii]GCE20828.1 ABC transporter ATP-binding protein [Dictyobacter kobayashii]
MATLIIDLLSKRYEKQRWALQDISLQLDAGIWGLIGPNGAGKTTLLRILATLLTPTRGSVTWNGTDVLRHPQVLRHHLGYLPQDFGVYPQLTAREFLHYIGELKGLQTSALKRRVDEVLEVVHLTRDADRRLKSYSGGMIRRVGIAQTLLNDPQVLILDEPTVGLDPAERVQFRETITTLGEERIVILSTHIISDVEAMASDIALIQQGQLHWRGTPEALLDDAASVVWSATLNSAEFEHIRKQCQVSQVIRRGALVEARMIAPVQPHPKAINIRPTLEDAYLYMQGNTIENQELLTPLS